MLFFFLYIKYFFRSGRRSWQSHRFVLLSLLVLLICLSSQKQSRICLTSTIDCTPGWIRLKLDGQFVGQTLSFFLCFQEKHNTDTPDVWVQLHKKLVGIAGRNNSSNNNNTGWIVQPFSWRLSSNFLKILVHSYLKDLHAKTNALSGKPTLLMDSYVCMHLYTLFQTKRTGTCFGLVGFRQCVNVIIQSESG